MVLALIVPAALRTKLRTRMLFQRWCGRNSGSAAPPEQLLQTTTCQKSAENTFCDWSKEQEVFLVTVTLQSCKKLSFAAKILLHTILSSNAHAVASGCYFWQKSWFSDDTTATPKGTVFSDKEPFPWAFDCTITRRGKWCYPFPKPGTSLIIRKSLWHLNPLIGKWNQWSTINPHSN